MLFRSFIAPNESFKLQLAELELQVLGSSSVVKDVGKEWDFYLWNRFVWKGFYIVANTPDILLTLRQTPISHCSIKGSVPTSTALQFRLKQRQRSVPQLNEEFSRSVHDWHGSNGTLNSGRSRMSYVSSDVSHVSNLDADARSKSFSDDVCCVMS